MTEVVHPILLPTCFHFCRISSLCTSSCRSYASARVAGGDERCPIFVAPLESRAAAMSFAPDAWRPPFVVYARIPHTTKVQRCAACLALLVRARRGLYFLTVRVLEAPPRENSSRIANEHGSEYAISV